MREFVEKLIERLEEELHLADEEKRKVDALQFDRVVGYGNGVAVALGIVNQLAEEYVPETNVGKWIPCSERLPDAGRRYLVIAVWKDGDFKKHSIYTFVFGTDGLWHSHNYEPVSCEVIAWQPLPKPYKPEPQKEMPTDHFTERFNRVL